MTGSEMRLGQQKRGYKGVICGFDSATSSDTTDGVNRLRDIGFSEGLPVEILHQNPFGKDPIAVQVGGMTVAVRRKDAAFVLVEDNA